MTHEALLVDSVIDGELTHPRAAHPDRDRNLAHGIQRRAAEAGIGRADTDRLRLTVGIHYHQHRILDQAATESGRASVLFRL